MTIIPATARERMVARTMICLERLIADSTKPETMRRYATLRLGRLRAAQRTAKPSRPAAPPPATTRATPPPSPQACFEAVQSFRDLSRQRTALFRKRRSEGERQILATMTALMPSDIPQGSDPKAWSDVIDRIDLILSEIKNIKNL